jgi:hypothetical protein
MIQRTTRRHIPENSALNIHRYENLKSNINRFLPIILREDNIKMDLQSRFEELHVVQNRAQYRSIFNLRVPQRSGDSLTGRATDLIKSSL